MEKYSSLEKKILILFAIVFVIGCLFCNRNKKTSTVTKTEYVKLPTIIGKVEQPIPEKETTPKTPIFPEIVVEYDTIFKTDTFFVIQKIDTLVLISDYIKRRDYRITLIDSDTIGTIVVMPTVQYNTLSFIDYEFTPTRKETTTSIIIEKKRIVMPFVSASCLFGDSFSIGGGAFYYNVGVEYQYIPDGSRHWFSVKYKF